MTNTQLTTNRLRKQQISLLKEPMQHAFVKRQGHLNFYFCVYNMDGDFKDGFYFGLLELHANYPFAAPKLYFYTPNGRYQVNVPICTSFTNYHQESWTSAWNVRSLIQGTISFMYSNEASYGCIDVGSEARKKMARQSLKWNMDNQLFVKLFGEQIKQKLHQLIKIGITIHHQGLLNLCNLSSIEPKQENQGIIQKLVKKISNSHPLQQKLIEKQIQINQQQFNEKAPLRPAEKDIKQIFQAQPQNRNNKKKIIVTVIAAIGVGLALYLKYR